MKTALYAAVVLVVTVFAANHLALEDPDPKEKHAGSGSAGAAARPAGAHAAARGGEHSMMLPDQLQWRDSPALKAPAKVAILEGDPTKEGYFAMRVKLPDGYRIPPHFHPCYERVTVISGTFNLGAGEKFDKSAAKALPAGSYWSMEPGMRHFAWTSGETVLQVTTIGPWGITYVNPSDDPRRGSGEAARAKE
jgi:quercetin dioxygenase-like cupin family protein